MEANAPLESSNSTCSKKQFGTKRPFYTRPCRIEWQNGSIGPSKRGWWQCSNTPDWSWNSGPKHCRRQYIWSIYSCRKQSCSKCRKHYGQGRNRAMIDFVYSDAKPTHSSHRRKGQIGTPCNKVHISRLWNQWGIRLQTMGPGESEINPKQWRTLQWRLHSLLEPAENNGKKCLLQNRHRWRRRTNPPNRTSLSTNSQRKHVVSNDVPEL